LITTFRSVAGLALAPLLLLTACYQPGAKLPLETVTLQHLEDQLDTGDIVFIRVTALPFRKIAQDTGSWTNHVGIVSGQKDGVWQVSESTLPVSRTTSFKHFVSESENGRVAVERLNHPLSEDEKERIGVAAKKRLGILYDTGFDLHSHREFCSRYVYEVMDEAAGEKVGEVTTLRALLDQNPDADKTFWQTWYLGSIPWERETVTPAAMLASPKVHAVFDGYVEIKSPARAESKH